MSRPIQVGDTVDVYYNEGVRYDCEVLHTPQDIGDMWYFKDTQGNTIAHNPMSSRLDFIKKMAKPRGE